MSRQSSALHTRLPIELREELDRYVAATDNTVSGATRAALEDYLEWDGTKSRRLERELDAGATKGRDSG